MDQTQTHFHEATFTDKQGQSRTSRVPSVQELARQGLDRLPSRFIQPHPEPDRPIAPNPVPDLPCISVAKLRARGGSGPKDRARELERLARGAREWGMFVITDHGIDSCVLDRVKDVVRGFFGLSFEDKKACVGSYSMVDNMGYGRNFVKSEDQPLDWIDRLAMKAAPRGATRGLDVWPRNPPNFRRVVEKYSEEARRVLDELLESLAESLSLETQAFAKNFAEEESEINVRVNYYPPCPRPDLAMGITPHTDASGLTLLLQFGASGGLQVAKGEEWVDVPWEEEALLVSVGDLVEIMSGGRVKSPWHRVVTNEEVERFSLALFYNPPPTARIQPAVEDGDDGGLGRYREVVVGDYLNHFYEVSPTKDKRAIMFAMV